MNASDFLDAPEAAAGAGAPSTAEDFLDATPQMTGAARAVALPASAAAKGLVSTLGLPSDLARLYSAYVGEPFANLVSKTVLGAPSRGGVWNPVGTSEKLLNATRQLGITDRPDLAPQGEGERIEAAGFQGGGAALPFSIFGGVPGLVSGLGAGGGGGVGSYEGQKLGAIVNHPELGAFVGGALGGMGGGAVGNALVRGANAVIGNVSPTVKAYEEAGVKPVLAGDVTGNPTLQRIQSFAAQTPGGATRTQGAVKAAVKQFGDAVENTASDLGESVTQQDAGQALQNESRDWLKDFKTDGAAKWATVDSYMPSTDRVPVANYVSALDKVSKSLEGAPATARVLQPALSGKLLQSLQEDVGAGSLQGATLPWGTVKGIRTRIGEMLSDPNLPPDTGTAELKRLYAGLSADMQGAVAASDAARVAAGQAPRAAQAFADAADFTRRGHAFIEDILSPIVRQGQTPEGAAQAALSGAGRGGTGLAALRQEMPEAADELAAFKLRDMAQATPGAQNAAGTAVSPSSFLTEMNKLSPEAKSALFPDIQAKIDALGKVAQSMKETARTANFSNTGPYLATKALLEAPERAILTAGGGYALGGLPGALAGGVGGAAYPFLPGWLAAQLTTRPWITRVLAAKGAPGFPGQSALYGSIAPIEAQLRAP